MTDERSSLTERAHRAAYRVALDPEHTPADIANAVCRELAEWAHEEAVFHAARYAPKDGSRMKGPDYAHVSVIGQLADYLNRVGDERLPS